MSNQTEFTGEYNYPQSISTFKIPCLRTEEGTGQQSQAWSGYSSVLEDTFEQQSTPHRFTKVQDRLNVHRQNRPAKRKNDPGASLPGGPNKMDVDPEDPQNQPKRNRMSHALMDMLAEDLPEELKSLMSPLNCNLCNVKINSVLTANMHYESKNHEKKINNWLQDWSKKTGQPVPKRQKANKEGPVGPNAFHCEVCDIPLTSLAHARTHYTGRKHQLVMSGRSKPSGSGYYSPDGKWVRQMTKPAADTSGRFGIGEAFQKPPAPPPAPSTSNQSNFCSLCNISVTSDSQMKIHLEGAKHNKRLKASTAATFPPVDDDTVMESIIQQQSGNVTPKRDISINRTPSGNYYCNVCDITVANEHLFNQHLDSKKHMKKLKASQS
ncbi:zinc finger matrin-type protein 3-like [Phlebotomus papatasi]|uniref:zinc finger matrin-type protein 3-like n=1 Tax=Phlebotomus papatasi TaxID=29031 RepID=UPI002484689B|nr:zinc finger matrin-type protein 3-like [Phlebotomus papatasi]